ncbi:hypothetical protein D3C71_1740660 [compost metagenome]
MTYGRHNLSGKARALLDRRSAVAIGALIGAAPEKLINQIAMSPMDFNGVETQAFGIRCCLGESSNCICNILFAHRHTAGVVWRIEARWTFHRRIWLPTADVTHCAGVPELRPHPATRIVNRVDHVLPSG